MIKFSTILSRFGEQGEKTGWTYIEIPAKLAQQLKPGNKKSFRVKGSLDEYNFKSMALIPMGEGNFIMAIKSDIRKILGKRKGDSLKVIMEADESEITLNNDLLKCLAEEPEAHAFFNTLAAGHRKYFSNWIESAKTEVTRTTRIAHTVTAMIRKEDYGTMIRRIKEERGQLFN